MSTFYPFLPSYSWYSTYPDFHSPQTLIKYRHRLPMAYLVTFPSSTPFTASTSSDARCIISTLAPLVCSRTQPNAVLHELILHLIHTQQYTQALNEMELYTAESAYRDDQVLYYYAGLVCVWLGQGETQRAMASERAVASGRAVASEPYGSAGGDGRATASPSAGVEGNDATQRATASQSVSASNNIAPFMQSTSTFSAAHPLQFPLIPLVLPTDRRRKDGSSSSRSTKRKRSHRRGSYSSSSSSSSPSMSQGESLDGSSSYTYSSSSSDSASESSDAEVANSANEKGKASRIRRKEQKKNDGRSKSRSASLDESMHPWPSIPTSAPSQEKERKKKKVRAHLVSSTLRSSSSISSEFSKEVEEALSLGKTRAVRKELIEQIEREAPHWIMDARRWFEKVVDSGRQGEGEKSVAVGGGGDDDGVVREALSWLDLVRFLPSLYQSRCSNLSAVVQMARGL